ncbi:MAG: NADH-quinone oxidoreductase subunit M [Aquificaceae bacterium]|nr:MAG: NADH-quinone oxidoreductase subunit M [Aquificaceae bacterium]
MALHYSDFSWLSLLILLLPFCAALTLATSSAMARWIALVTHLVVLLISIGLAIDFDASLLGFQYVEKSLWIATLNIHYFLGVDGISILFLPATALLFTAVTLASWNSIQTMQRLYFSLLLILEATILGVFSALDTIFFMLFWEATLIPLYFLISLWGVGANRRYVGVKYVLLMMGGGLPILFAFVLLAIQGDGSYIFDYTKLVEIARSNQYQSIIFFLLLFGFGVKIPLFPLHTWLPVLAQEGHPATIATVVGLKLGAYGLLRFVVPLAPDAAHSFQDLMIGLGIIGVIYGGVAALSQTNLRRMLAFSSLSHVGMIVLGIATLSQQGIQGAVFQLLNLTMLAGGLFLLIGFLHQRIGSTDIISLGGVAKTMPLLSAFFFFLGLANMSVPGTATFPAELLIIISVLDSYAGVGLATLFGVILGAAYFLGIYRKAFLGECRSEIVAEAVDLQTRELLIIFVMSAIILLVGLYPQMILDTMRTATDAWVELLQP